MNLLRCGLATSAVGAALLTFGCSANEPEKASVATPSPSTTVASVPTSAPARGRSQWTGNGVFSVGRQPTGGAEASIPPGRYTVEMANPALEALAVIRCTGLPCSEAEHFLGADTGFGREYTSVIEILPTDGAVRLTNATLTLVRDS